MEVKVLPRGQGKTKRLIEISAATGQYIVCKDAREADYIISLSKAMNYIIPHPLTFDEFLSDRYYGKGIKGVLIDNAEMLLERISKVRVSAITLRSTEEDAIEQFRMYNPTVISF